MYIAFKIFQFRVILSWCRIAKASAGKFWTIIYYSYTALIDSCSFPMASVVLSPFPTPSPSQTIFIKNGIKKMLTISLCSANKAGKCLCSQKVHCLPCPEGKDSSPGMTWVFKSICGAGKVTGLHMDTLAAVFVCCAHHPLFSSVGICFNSSSSAGRQGMACSSSVTSMYFLLPG